MRIKLALGNLLLLLVSATVGLVLCEVGARLLLNPADYLSVETVRDDILGIKMPAGARGFDDWGFRNGRVPEKADVVAIGDSHTYGNNAAMVDSWPAVAGRASGLEVYNLGLGGYGPNQYYYLLKTHGFKLKPTWVVCALYMGDDFENAFLMTYGREYWSFLRKGQWTAADADIWGTTDTTTWHKQLRAWLSRNSVIYRLVVHGQLLGRVKGAIQIQRASSGQDPEITTLLVSEAGIQEAFRPLAIRSRLDQRSPTVREGMRITFELLGRMNQMSRENGSRFLVVVIPTKETVFADYLLRNPATHLRKSIEELVADERVATTELVGFLDSSRIPHVEALPALRRELSQRLYTRSDQDMHPAKNGYHVIGQVVARFLQEQARTGAVH